MKEVYSQALDVLIELYLEVAGKAGRADRGENVEEVGCGKKQADDSRADKKDGHHLLANQTGRVFLKLVQHIAEKHRDGRLGHGIKNAEGETDKVIALVIAKVAHETNELGELALFVFW